MRQRNLPQTAVVGRRVEAVLAELVVDLETIMVGDDLAAVATMLDEVAVVINPVVVEVLALALGAVDRVEVEAEMVVVVVVVPVVVTISIVEVVVKGEEEVVYDMTMHIVFSTFFLSVLKISLCSLL